MTHEIVCLETARADETIQFIREAMIDTMTGLPLPAVDYRLHQAAERQNSQLRKSHPD